MRLHVRVAGEELQADAAGVLVVGKGGGLKVGVLVVLLILMGLQHHLQGGVGRGRAGKQAEKEKGPVRGSAAAAAAAGAHGCSTCAAA